MNPARIELLILDVDGVLTDGRIVMEGGGERTKHFHVQDGCAIKLWRRCGGKVAILSGRSAEAVDRRARELGVDWVHTGVERKLDAYKTILASSGLGDAHVAYVGDDLPDLGPMARSAFPLAVSDAVPAVKRSALYITRRGGGCGAVAEIVELLLRKKGRWSQEMIENV